MLGTAFELHYDPMTIPFGKDSEHPLVKFNIAIKKKSEIDCVVKYRIKTPR
jgi:hypothetical protein